MSNEESPSLRRLNWGETPWDHLSRDELLREVQRLYSALKSAQSEVRCSRLANPHSPYWTDPQGFGARVLAKVEMAIQKSEAAKCDSDDVYRQFFRYAVDLLFTPEIGFGWWICDVCGTMMGAPHEGQDRTRECYTPACNKAPLRPITWDDLKCVNREVPT
jgi:hypothetical protein